MASNKGEDISRDDINKWTLPPHISTYHQGLHMMNAVLLQQQVPLPQVRLFNQSFAQRVQQNIQLLNQGAITPSTAFGAETPFLAKDAVENSVQAMNYGHQENVRYKTGRAFTTPDSDNAEQAFKHTKAAFVSFVGTVATAGASMFSAVKQKGDYNTGKEFTKPDIDPDNSGPKPL